MTIYNHPRERNKKAEITALQDTKRIAGWTKSEHPLPRMDHYSSATDSIP